MPSSEDVTRLWRTLRDVAIAHDFERQAEANPEHFTATTDGPEPRTPLARLAANLSTSQMSFNVGPIGVSSVGTYATGNTEIVMEDRVTWHDPVVFVSYPNLISGLEPAEVDYVDDDEDDEEDEEDEEEDVDETIPEDTIDRSMVTLPFIPYDDVRALGLSRRGPWRGVLSAAARTQHVPNSLVVASCIVGQDRVMGCVEGLLEHHGAEGSYLSRPDSYDYSWWLYLWVSAESACDLTNLAKMISGARSLWGARGFRIAYPWDLNAGYSCSYLVSGHRPMRDSWPPIHHIDVLDLPHLGGDGPDDGYDPLCEVDIDPDTEYPERPDQ